MAIELFPNDKRIGVFRGFQEGGLEFHADLVFPYQSQFQSIPMHGQFLLVQLETQNEAVLGRISSLSSDGKLSIGAGEEFNLRAMKENREIPEDLREQYLKYRVNIRVLGVLRKNNNNKLTFVASHRRLPHVGSPVGFPSDEVLREIAGHNVEGGAGIGFFALGEYIYSGSSNRLSVEEWMQVKQPEVEVKFPISSLVARRTFIFARAGFGKSNLNKLLFSELYRETPTVEKRGGRKVPVGTIIFDPDGEYFWPDDKNRPGLCDVPELENKLVVFTSRQAPSDYYQSFVAGGIKLDIRRLRPADVIAIAISQEKQDQQNIRKLKGMSQQRWAELVNLIDRAGNTAELGAVGRLLDLEERSEAEATAARSNMTSIVKSLHDKSSQMLDMLLLALKEGKLCIVDVSQMRGGQSLILSGIILRYIFDNNQREFTSAEPKTIPTIAVIEEAQSVLNERSTSAEPYIAWVKEGRKYDLGALLVTQQPGSIPTEILSQGDNWFIFHLLSTADLTAVRKANAHFSDDLLSSLLNEPIPGQGVFWSSVSGTPYPVALRALSFEKLNTIQDPNYSRAAAHTFAQELQNRSNEAREQGRRAKESLAAMRRNDSGVADDFPNLNAFLDGTDDANALPISSVDAAGNGNGVHANSDPFATDDLILVAEDGDDDFLSDLLAIAIQTIQQQEQILSSIRSEGGASWWEIQKAIMNALPNTLPDAKQTAYDLLPKAMNSIFGVKPSWDTFKNSQNRTCVRTQRTASTG